MGLISFIKNAGTSILGGSEAKAAPAAGAQEGARQHGVDASNVKIEVDGDKVKVSGAPPITEQAEKIAIALGNTVGAQTVENEIKPAAATPSRSSIRSREATRSGRSPSAKTAREGVKYDVIFHGTARCRRIRKNLSGTGFAHPAAQLRRGHAPLRSGEGSEGLGGAPSARIAANSVALTAEPGDGAIELRSERTPPR